MMNTNTTDIESIPCAGPAEMAELISLWDGFPINGAFLDLYDEDISPLLSLAEVAAEVKVNWRYHLWASIGRCEKCGEVCNGVCDIPF